MITITVGPRLCLLSHRKPPGRQNGIALIIVLWLIVLLGVIATGHARNVHSETRLAMRQIETAKTRTLAEAGIQRAIISLMLQNNAAEFGVSGTVRRLNINEREVSVAVRDATGLVDLNAADASLLGVLFTASGGDPKQQEELVYAILDWRDADNFTHLHGAEDAAYRAAGIPWSARDAAFTSVDELRYVMGMTPDIFKTIASHVTVYSGQAGLNLDYASPYLASLITGQTIDENIDGAGRQSTDRTRAGSAVTRNGTYHIYSSATGKGNVSASVEAVVNISATAEAPYTILYWREPARFQFARED